MVIVRHILDVYLQIPEEQASTSVYQLTLQGSRTKNCMLTKGEILYLVQEGMHAGDVCVCIVSVCMYACMHVHVRMYINICVYVCMHACTCTYVYNYDYNNNTNI